MKKTITATVAALFLTTSLVGPARANDDVIRLGIGIAGALFGEAMKGGKERQPRRGDKMEGRVGDRQAVRERQTRDKGREAAPVAAAAVATVALPEIIPTPEAKPTAEEMAAWVADAPNREQVEVEMEMAATVELDTTTTAATATEAKPEAATVEAVDNDGKSWGMITPSQQAKAMQFAALGMNLAAAYRAIGLTGPVATTADADGIDLIDENGKLWGNVPDATADKVWKAVDLGMKPSQAFAALSGLPHPDDKAKADVAAATAKADEDAKMLAYCLEPLRMTVPMTECRPYKAQQEAKRAEAKAAAEEQARMTAEAFAKKQKEEAEARAFNDMLTAKTAEQPAAIVAEKPVEIAKETPPVVVVEQPAKVETTAEQPVVKPKPKLKLDL
ncbi:hypothetical protein [Agrobacterium tumefaciens]|uniref:hypothetical protein n=1 Tax=Agrobacterium tumefaciens TaxID=358 RepID=UPI001572F575|nr:hypothetical protein [Agrobacterium tumefaciens]